jgi:hypothetical protein
MITNSELLSAASRLTKALDDLALDSPKAADQAAHVFGTLWRTDLSALHEFLGFLKNNTSPVIAKKALAALLRVLIDAGLSESSRAVWQSQPIVSESERSAFLQQYALESLDSGTVILEALKSAWKSADTDSLAQSIRSLGSPDPLQLQKISKLLCELADADNQRERLSTLKLLAPALPQQIRVLIGAHEAWHFLGESKGDLQRVFDALYLAKVVTRKAIERWLEDKSDDVPNKGQALFEINPWWTRKLQEERDAAKLAKEKEKSAQS